jgi:tRNA(Ile)-lysidine synthase
MSDGSAASVLDKALAASAPDARALLVGFSGGLDSSVLLHRLATTAPLPVRAIHVHHGLHPEADRWARHCRVFCRRVGVDLAVVGVQVDRAAGEGLEAAARHARYAAFAAALAAGECLVTAHHQDDQAETVLLRLLRASGPGGLSAMRPLRAFAGGRHWRPLLGVSRAVLLEYARDSGLEWLDDPANAEARHDRNFLRREILPALGKRWPHAAAALAHSAELMAEQEVLLDEIAGKQLARVQGVDPGTLSVAGLLQISTAWRARVIRRWVETLDLPPLPATGVESLETQLLTARPDARSQYRWHGAAIRRWRDLLYAEALVPALPAGWGATWDGTASLELPTGARLSLLRAESPAGDAPSAACAPFRVGARTGGERIALPRRAHSHAVKTALQDAGVPPWQRQRLPLVFAADGELLAVGDILQSSRALASGWHFRVEEAEQPRRRSS